MSLLSTVTLLLFSVCQFLAIFFPPSELLLLIFSGFGNLIIKFVGTLSILIVTKPGVWPFVAMLYVSFCAWTCRNLSWPSECAWLPSCSGCVQIK